MARTAVTADVAVRDGGEDLTVTTIDSTLVTNGVKVSCADAGHMYLVVYNSSGAARDVTIQQGDMTWTDSLGDLVYEIGTTETAVLGPFTTSRFESAGELLLVDFESGFTGTLLAVKTKR